MMEQARWIPASQMVVGCYLMSTGSQFCKVLDVKHEGNRILITVRGVDINYAVGPVDQLLEYDSTTLLLVTENPHDAALGGE